MTFCKPIEDPPYAIYKSDPISEAVATELSRVNFWMSAYTVALILLSIISLLVITSMFDKFYSYIYSSL